MLEEQQPARRQQSRRAARRADGGRALPQSSLRPAGDRLAARDREAQPRGRARVLRRFYTPNNAILVVAGDVTADEVKALAEETYGKVAARRRDRAARAAAGAGAGRAAHASRSPIRASRSRACSATIWCRPTPPRKPGEAEALDVLAHILGGGTNSRLYRTLVVETRHRGQRRRLVLRHRARRDALRRLRHAEARRHAAAARRRRSTR